MTELPPIPPIEPCAREYYEQDRAAALNENRHPYIKEVYSNDWSTVPGPLKEFYMRRASYAIIAKGYAART